MADEGGEKVRRSGALREGAMPGFVPTGSDIVSEGSSVELDAELVTKEEIPSVEEILRRGGEARKRRRRPRGYVPPAPPAPGKKPFVPHDKGPGE